MVKKTFCVCCIVLILTLFIVSVSADTLTISGSYYDGDIMNGVTSAVYHYSLEQGGSSTGYKVSVPLKEPGYSGYLDRDYPYLRYNIGVKTDGNTTRSYFFAFDLDTLNFTGKKVTSISLPVCFGMGSYGTISGDGFIARLTVDGVEVGDYFNLTYKSAYDIDGATGLVGCNVFTGVINYKFPVPVDVARIGVHVIRANNDARPYAYNGFCIGFGNMYYEYISAETIDIIPPEQQEALGDMSKDFAYKESQAQEILGDMNVPQIDYVPPELSFENESLVAGALSDVLDAVPSLKVLLGVGLSLTVLAVVLYGVRGL